jgi:hypothetical protein
MNLTFDEAKIRAIRYSIEHVAGCYSRCVEWKGEGSRQLEDWINAEKHVTQSISPELVEKIALEIIKNSAISNESLDCQFGRTLFHFSQCFRRALPQNLYGKAIF